MLLPEVPAEGADRHKVQALPGRTLHLAEGARLGVGAEAPLLVGGVATCRVELLDCNSNFTGSGSGSRIAKMLKI